jgi:Na+-driven multidrug efflux pump
MMEDGAMPGEGLTALETALYFFGAPLALFIGISVLVLIATADRKGKKNKSNLTSIE